MPLYIQKRLVEAASGRFTHCDRSEHPAHHLRRLMRSRQRDSVWSACDKLGLGTAFVGWPVR